MEALLYQPEKSAANPKIANDFDCIGGKDDWSTSEKQEAAARWIELLKNEQKRLPEAMLRYHQSRNYQLCAKGVRGKDL